MGPVPERISIDSRKMPRTSHPRGWRNEGIPADLPGQLRVGLGGTVVRRGMVSPCSLLLCSHGAATPADPRGSGAIVPIPDCRGSLVATLARDPRGSGRRRGLPLWRGRSCGSERMPSSGLATRALGRTHVGPSHPSDPLDRETLPGDPRGSGVSSERSAAGSPGGGQLRDARWGVTERDAKRCAETRGDRREEVAPPGCSRAKRVDLPPLR